MKPLPIGIDDFKKLIDKNYYYVDKTLLIKELLDKKAEVTLFTRPRRFGKTLNMSMLQYFFEKTEEDNSYLFKELKIINESKKYLEHMGKYPVINLSLKSAKQPTFEMSYKKIKEAIADEFKRYSEVLNGNILFEDEKEDFTNIMLKKADISTYNTSLKFLSKCLKRYYKKDVIILIDEYDVPLENAFFEGFYDKMVKFLRSLFESALKTNPSLEFAVVTGCLRISKESIFTGLNNLKINSILDDKYAEYFGFTDKEVIKICNDYNMSQKYKEIKEWYNGYIFGETNVYNPWSVIQYIDDLKTNINKYPSSYWANTSSNSIVKTLIEKADDDTKEEIESLIEGKSIEKPIHEDITYDEVYKSMDNLWNFMFFTGYFKKVSESMSSTGQKFIKLEIPNKEVKYIFITKIENWLDERIENENFDDMYNAMFEGDEKSLENEITDLLLDTISFHDSYENFYRGFLAGILAKLRSYNYKVKSNRENGMGCSDIIVQSTVKKGKAVIIEIKVAKDIKDLEKKCNEALEQIEKNKYDIELIQYGYKDILKYGITFFKKKCMVKLKK
ncbi:MAG: ATP-binding protein [Clostridium sp.]|nr:ATP-binding protein [Clostridium sp.]MCI7441610.1 ATP-binding protein [Clostridium sp.]